MTRSAAGRRLPPGASQLIDRAQPVAFEFDGETVDGFEGDTVASALVASGASTLSRSFKYHRPRGLLCAEGHCPNCLVNVDGVPNVRACTTPARPGMLVRHQNAWPSLRWDVLSVLDRLDRFLPVGFYYKAFHRPRWAWRIVQPIIRRIAGLGVVDLEAAHEKTYRHRQFHVEVAVVGGGPAGMTAALHAAANGARVALIDDQPTLGGSLRYGSAVYSDLPDVDGGAGFEIAEELARAVDDEPGVEVFSNATAFGLYQDGTLAVLQGDLRLKLRCGQIVIATGAYEQPMLFEGNDLPGVMLGTAALRLIHLYGVRPGTKAVVATVDESGYRVAVDLLNAGVEVAAVADAREQPAEESVEAGHLEAAGVPVLRAHVPVRATGRGRVGAVEIVPTDGSGAPHRFKCDLLCMSGGFEPAAGLLAQAGVVIHYDEELGATVPVNLPVAIHTAGAVRGIRDLRLNLLQAQLAGIEAAGAEATRAGPDAARNELAEADEGQRRTPDPSTLLAAARTGHKEFVCYCEDVTLADVSLAVDEGFGDVQTLKRYTTATMGPCQGKMCHRNFVAAAAAVTGSSVAELGSTTARPPLAPVPLGALAGPSHMPIKRTPLDAKNRALGASMVDLGPWQRAHSYGDPADEVMAVRQRVGIIDVSTLGKLDIRGHDAGALLDAVYTGRFSNLRPGRIRYGMLCAEDGSILDDGTVTLLGDGLFFVTTTSGNIELMEQWFKWWIAAWRMRVYVTDVTSAYAAINVAGPRARETLAKLTSADLSPEGFRYMRSAQTGVAGVEAILLRIGFVGETGWEIHFPAEYADHMWDALMEAGGEFGIEPFGLEAQRILRLEKKHLIVNQDTDALSNPIESDMEWAVRFEKEDFIGRAGLIAARERGLHKKLVGFVMSDGRVPEDGDPVLVGGEPVGRITSARMSPTIGRGFGMAWVPVSMAVEGAGFIVRSGDDHLEAEVRLAPVYDPDGERLRA